MNTELCGWFETPWGQGSVTVRHGHLVRVELPPLAPVTKECEQNARRAAPADRLVLDKWLGELDSYFRGKRLSWAPDDLSMEELGLGAFEKAVYSALLSIPAGVTVSYGALAQMAGYPRAARAVGNAMASNPVPIVIPCHRVIRSDGSLGNYGNDPALKGLLLDHERRFAAEGGNGP